jgi:Flp pilus assembly pilin Flp
LRTLLFNLIRDESGVTAIAAFTLVGTNFSNTFSTIAAKL